MLAVTKPLLGSSHNKKNIIENKEVEKESKKWPEFSPKLEEQI